MASFSASCPSNIKSSALLGVSGGSQIQNQQSKISFQLTSKSRHPSSLLSESSSIDHPALPRFQGTTRKQSNIWKVHAQLNKVTGKTSNSAPLAQTNLEVPSVEGKKDGPAKQSAVQNGAPDPSSISAFMDQVSELVKLVDSRDIIELQLKQQDCELIIRKKEALPQPPAAPIVMMQPPSQGMVSSQSPQSAPSPPASPTPAPSAPALALPPPPAKSKSSHPPLKCPMAGTFYRCPGPGEPPFVKIGDKVQKGQVVCIIEAMKLMNEIEADQSGTLVEVLVEDGKPVSVDMPLFVIAP